MLTKTTIALSIALVMGAASSAVAQYQFDSSGAPINMHTVDALQDIYASTRPLNVRSTRPTTFNAAEKMLFDRTSRPEHVGEEG
jgi:hypothetical protein